MSKPTIYIACDHAGVELKKFLIHSNANVNWQNLGTDNTDSVDYSDFADKLCIKLKEDPKSTGVLICGSGIGISIRANRYPHIRAALCLTPEMSKLARLHNDANVLCLGSRLTNNEHAQEILLSFLLNSFEGGRHTKRVEKLKSPLSC